MVNNRPTDASGVYDGQNVYSSDSSDSGSTPPATIAEVRADVHRLFGDPAQSENSQRMPPGRLHTKDDPDHDPVQIMGKHSPFRFSNEFPPLRKKDFDTAVYLGVPSTIPGQDKADYDHVRKHFSAVHLICSTSLKQFNSPKLSDLFKPNACIRAEKKFKKLDAYNQLSPSDKAKIKYHINLQPPEDGDDAAILMMNMTCTHGIRSWHLASDLYKLLPNIVEGVDEFDTPHNPYYMTLAMALKGPPDVQLPMPAEYCPMRQRSGLERFLNAAIGHDPRLDSACKMWTFFATIQYFGVAHETVFNWWIMNWFNAPGNSHFVQNNPEVAYRIGMGCRFGDFIRDAFAILVGEKALADIWSQTMGQVASSKESIHGRPYEILDDDERNRVSHAASSLIARVHDQFDNLALKEDWLSQSAEYRKLINYQPSVPEHARLINSAQEGIWTYIRRKLLDYLVIPLRKPHEELFSCSPETPLRHARHTLDLLGCFNGLPNRARPFTRSFWLGLGQINLEVSSPVDDYFQIQSEPWHLNSSQAEDPVLVHIGSDYRSNQEEMLDLRRKVQVANEVIMGNCYTCIPVDPLYSPDQAMMAAAPHPISAPTSQTEMVTQSDLDIAANQEKVRTMTQFPIEVDAIDLWPLKRAQEGDTWSSGKRRKTIESAGPSADILPFRPLPPSSAEAKPYVPNKRAQPSRDHLYGPGPAILLSDDAARDVGSDSEGVWEDAYNSPDDNSTLRSPIPNDATIKALRVTNPDMEQPAPSESVRFSDAIPTPDAGGYVARQYGNPQSSPFGPSDFPPPPTHDPSARIGLAPDAESERWSTTAAYSAPLTSRLRPILRTPDIRPSHSCPVSLPALLQEASNHVRKVAQEMIYPPHLFHGSLPVPINLLDFAVALSDEQWKFLPLWVEGGCDDGSGGVFDATIPNIEGNDLFKGGKRGMDVSSRKDTKAHATGNNNDGDGDMMSMSESDSESEFSEVQSRDALSSRARASHAATDGTATVKSISETGSEAGFMNQDDVYEVIQQMKMEQAVADGGNALNGRRTDADDDDDGDGSTIMGAASIENDDDVQGEFFGDVDDDHEVEDENVDEAGFEDDDDFMPPSGSSSHASVDVAAESKGNGRAEGNAVSEVVSLDDWEEV